MALLVLLVGILDVVYLQYGMKPGFGRFGPPFARFLNSLSLDWQQLRYLLPHALESAWYLLFGALMIDRLDRWRARGRPHV